jgi:hypothetical protein
LLSIQSTYTSCICFFLCNEEIEFDISELLSYARLFLQRLEMMRTTPILSMRWVAWGVVMMTMTTSRWPGSNLVDFNVLPLRKLRNTNVSQICTVFGHRNDDDMVVQDGQDGLRCFRILSAPIATNSTVLLESELEEVRTPLYVFPIGSWRHTPAYAACRRTLGHTYAWKFD